MKTLLLLLLAAVLLVALIWQRSDALSRAGRDAATIAELQRSNGALGQENRALRQKMQKQAAIRGALATSVPIAARYRDSRAAK